MSISPAIRPTQRHRDFLDGDRASFAFFAGCDSCTFAGETTAVSLPFRKGAKSPG